MPVRLMRTAAVLIVFLAASPGFAQAPDGAQVFTASCANCHSGAADSRASALDALRSRTPEAIIEALMTGAMRPQGSRLSGLERRAVAEFVTGKRVGGDVAGASTGRCSLASTGSPTFSEGRLYVPVSSYEEAQGADPQYPCCTFRGSVSALDASSGRVLWKTYMIPDAPQRRGTSTAGVPLWGPSGSGWRSLKSGPMSPENRMRRVWLSSASRTSSSTDAEPRR